MATNEQIQFVKDAIEPDFETHGWSDLEITSRIDAGTSPERVVAAYWRRRASQTILLVNTSESGSSRGMDAVYSRMKALAEEWEKKADDLEQETATTGRARNGVITRV